MKQSLSQGLYTIYFARSHSSNLAGNKKSHAINHSLSLISSHSLLINSGKYFVRSRCSRHSFVRRLSFLSLCLDLVVTTIVAFAFVVRMLLIHKKSKILFVFYNLMIDTTLPGILVQKLFCFLPFVARTILGASFAIVLRKVLNALELSAN